jgi:hypothetical protein
MCQAHSLPCSPRARLDELARRDVADLDGAASAPAARALVPGAQESSKKDEVRWGSASQRLKWRVLDVRI